MIFLTLIAAGLAQPYPLVVWLPLAANVLLSRQLVVTYKEAEGVFPALSESAVYSERVSLNTCEKLPVGRSSGGGNSDWFTLFLKNTFKNQ